MSTSKGRGRAILRAIVIVILILAAGTPTLSLSGTWRELRGIGIAWEDIRRLILEYEQGLLACFARCLVVIRAYR